MSQSFSIVAAALKSQTITFTPIPPQKIGTPLILTATASSGLPVSYSAVPNGNCSVSRSVVTFLHTGDCGIVASQAGNATYSAAADVGQVILVQPANASFTIAPSALTLTLAPNQGGTLNVIANPINGFQGTVTYTATGIPAGIDYVFLQETSTQSILVVYVPAGTRAGSYTVKVTGTSGTTTATTTVTLVIS